MIYSFNVYGKPRPKPSPRFSKGHAYFPKYINEWKNKIITECFLVKPILDDGPIKINIAFYFYSKTLYTHTIKPDIDNLLKLVFDALKVGNMYKDDCQIYSIVAYKYGTHIKKEEGMYIRIFTGGDAL